MKFTEDDVNPYLSAEEQSFIKEQIRNSRNDGIYTPPSLRGSVQMPGNPGGANWGVTAANPLKGIVYVLGTNGPALLKLQPSAPGGTGANATFGISAGRGGGGRGANNAAATAGRNLFNQNCASCHGNDLRGGSGPSLANVAASMSSNSIKGTISTGKGAMPPFAGMSPSEMDSIVAYLANPAAANAGGGGGRGAPIPAVKWPAGVVVQSGAAAPGSLTPAFVNPLESRAGYGGNGGMVPYPAGLETPEDRYNSGYGLSPNAVKPPWSTITAYDLNNGTIKWQVPAGDDPVLAAQGIRGTGSRGLRTGIVSTATGLVFNVSGDNKVRAYDEDTGKVLWEHPIAGSSTGCPSIYEIDGREYLVISVSGPFVGGRGGGGAANSGLPSGYVVFALPRKS
jgi:quinoprotein glucose dehydrogenase